MPVSLGVLLIIINTYQLVFTILFNFSMWLHKKLPVQSV